MKTRLPLWILGAGTALVIVGGLAGCASKRPVARTVPPPGTVTREWEWVTPTGSHIPVKVPKHGEPLPGTIPTKTLSTEAFREMQNAGPRARR